jgi:N-acetyl-alpha-D-muramate 1-phosphate uridylyltransferase
MKAMIFAAGLGKRLGKITENIPKALVDINGKTALRLAVEKCSEHKFNDIIVNVHHFDDMVKAEIGRLNQIGYRISISDESDKLLETGGGLFKARDFFDNNPFLICNVDIISSLDITDLYKFHLEKRGLATLAVRNRPGNRFYLVNRSGLLCGWRNRTSREQIITRDSEEDYSEIAFSSIHVVEPEIFKYMHEGIYTMTDLYLRLAEYHNIYTFRDDSGYWYDIGTPDSLESARKLLIK